MTTDQLKLSNQFCFPLYAASRLITREYQPYLSKLQITYPQYLVLLILWETDNVPVHEITEKLILNTNTVTPLLKRMEVQGLIRRIRSSGDERKVILQLTEKGMNLKSEAASIPEYLGKKLISGDLKTEEILAMRDKLNLMIQHLAQLNDGEKTE